MKIPNGDNAPSLTSMAGRQASGACLQDPIPAAPPLSAVLCTTGIHAIGNAPKGPERGAVGAEGARPTFTFDEIAQDYRQGLFNKLTVANMLAYPRERSYAQDFSAFVEEIVHRMVVASPEDLSDIHSERLETYLLDRPSVGASVAPYGGSAIPLFINRGLLEEFLSAPELKENHLYLDAIAGVIAHEISHAHFSRSYKTPHNSSVQESYCDILPAKLLERAGFRPEALSRVCDIFTRVFGIDPAAKVEAGAVHASPTIRKEIFEKGGWDAYERERRKRSLNGEQGVGDTYRIACRARIENILEGSRSERIVSPLVHHLRGRGFDTASLEEKLNLLHDFITTHQRLICEKLAQSVSSEITSILVRELSKAPELREEISQHPIFVAMSVVLFRQHNDQKAIADYKSLAVALDRPQFGAFEGVDAAYLRLLRARTRSEALEALNGCERLLDLPVQTDITARFTAWPRILLPESIAEYRKIFTEDDYQRLKAGGTIPFPFAAHLSLKKEAMEATRKNHSESERDLKMIQVVLNRSGISDASHALLSRDSLPLEGLKWDTTVSHIPVNELLRGTEIGTLQAFDCSESDGITLLYPHRLLVDPVNDFTETEGQFASFIANRGELLLHEVKQLHANTFFDFVSRHLHLFAPQVHPVGILSPDLERRSHQLAQAVMKRFSELYAQESRNPGSLFATMSWRFLSRFSPAEDSTFLRVYDDYHRSVTTECRGARVSPKHPFVEAILENRNNLLLPDEQAVVISALNGFSSNFGGIQGAQLREAFGAAVGGEDRLRMMLGVQLSSTPGSFVDGLQRIGNIKLRLYPTNAVADEAVRDVRGQYINDYLDLQSGKRLSIEVLHTLHDLCVAPSCRIVARRIRGIATEEAGLHDLSRLSDREFIDMYQSIVAMGVTDTSVAIQELWQSEILRRCQRSVPLEQAVSFVTPLISSRSFSCGDGERRDPPGTATLVRFSGSEEERSTSIYSPRTADPRFEDRLVEAVVRIYAEQLRVNTGAHFDNKTELFHSYCHNLVRQLDEHKVPSMLRARILRGIADELLLQEESSALFQSNLMLQETHQSKCTFAALMTLTHTAPALTNFVTSGIHNKVVEMRTPFGQELRDSLFEFFITPHPREELSGLSEILLKALREMPERLEGWVPEVFRQLEIRGVSRFSSDSERAQQKEIIEYNLIALHRRFSDLDVRSKGAILSFVAVDESPTEEKFATFRDTVLLPRVLPTGGRYNDLLRAAITEYFEFYSNAVHHKYMVACAILTNSQERDNKISELETVGIITKKFLGAHGPGGYKLLQRIRNHPKTPREIKEVLKNVLDETISLPRWTVHQQLKMYGSVGEGDWVGRAKSGSLCLSVPVKRADGTESFVSVLQPGAHVDGMYWLQNFKTIAASLALLKADLGVLAPMTEQTRRLLEHETDFDSAAKLQQRIAERAYAYEMNFPASGVVVRSSVARLISSQSRPHSDFMQSSGVKEAEQVEGRALLEMIDEVRQRSVDGTWTESEVAEQIKVLKAVAFSVFSNEVRLIASGEGKDHDRHPGNYLISTRRNLDTGLTTIELRHYDFGCTDVAPPSPEALLELRAALTRALTTVGFFRMVTRPHTVYDTLRQILFERATYRSELASLPLGILAAMGANERLVVSGKDVSLLSAADMMRAFKVGLQAANIPPEMSGVLENGLKAKLLKRAYNLIDPQGTHFV